jgi:glycosyltransferase involved in cell wall biosynthesis
MKICIGILTKNREILLEKLLYSISKNTIKPTEIIIINNGSINKVNSILKQYIGILPIKHLKKTLNIPASRNYILKISDCDIVAFVDDDCIVDKSWIKNISNSHKKNSKHIAIQGRSFSRSRIKWLQNIIQDEYNNWILRNIIGKSLSVIDTKNVSLKLKRLKKTKILFNTYYSRASDIDLSYQLISNNEKILYDRSIIIYHQERNLVSLIKQRFIMGKFNSMVYAKWGSPFKRKKIHYKISFLSILFLNFPYILGYLYGKYFLTNK